MKQHFFLRSQYVCSVERGEIFIFNSWREPYGVGFYCPQCSELWFNAPIDGRPANVTTHLCEKHAGQFLTYEPPGVILLKNWPIYSEIPEELLPAQLVQREFDLWMKEALRCSGQS